MAPVVLSFSEMFQVLRMYVRDPFELRSKEATRRIALVNTL